ncbi:hypothetical protein [Bacillus toyonensis]|uniref:hypothetical protein n=1 Tax=Bacillus toyonensis TaxID=155322 RepID=UPI00027BEAAC|nr:hypothetical protein [Bacillus toyonensis]EJV41780.1 hypothetical protein IEA_05665 [Bacillus toyonensis]
MNVLEIVSRIWLTGANIYYDSVDGKLGIHRHELIDKELLTAAQESYSEIEAWFLEWNNESVENKTLQKILFTFSDIKQNDGVSKWLNTDQTSMYLFIDMTVLWAKQGMKSPFDDYRKYETQESIEIKNKLYRNAMTFHKRK